MTMKTKSCNWPREWMGRRIDSLSGSGRLNADFSVVIIGSKKRQSGDIFSLKKENNYQLGTLYSLKKALKTQVK